jgi:mono/diheme cytochrome c family protein
MRAVYGRAALAFGLSAAAVMMTSTFDSRAAMQRGFERDPGEVVMNRSCLGCHDLVNIRTQAFDVDGWNGVIDRMVMKGAEVSAEDKPLLANYLAETYGPMPDGEGREILLQNCTICHNRDRIWGHAGADREHWETTLLAMLNEGAFLTDAEFETLLDYLSTYLGP